jgi:hypothetical protein
MTFLRREGSEGNGSLSTTLVLGRLSTLLWLVLALIAIAIIVVIDVALAVTTIVLMLASIRHAVQLMTGKKRSCGGGNGHGRQQWLVMLRYCSCTQHQYISSTKTNNI